MIACVVLLSNIGCEASTPNTHFPHPHNHAVHVIPAALLLSPTRFSQVVHFLNTQMKASGDE